MSNVSISATPIGGQQSGPSSKGDGLFRVCHVAKVALLIDGEWFRRALDKVFSTQKAIHLPHGITADVFYRNAIQTINLQEEECFRIFYYDAEPYIGTTKNPIDGQVTDYRETPRAKARLRFFREFGALPSVALRRGECRGRGWELKDDFLKRHLKSGKPQVTVTANDVVHAFEQKGVDMRIGMDVATLSLKRIVDRLIILSGDTDLIPAMKLARREGLQVGVVSVGNNSAHSMLIEDSDFVRTVKPTA